MYHGWMEWSLRRKKERRKGEEKKKKGKRKEKREKKEKENYSNDEKGGKVERDSECVDRSILVIFGLLFLSFFFSFLLF